MLGNHPIQKLNVSLSNSIYCHPIKTDPDSHTLKIVWSWQEGRRNFNTHWIKNVEPGWAPNYLPATKGSDFFLRLTAREVC